jgi:Catalase
MVGVSLPVFFVRTPEDFIEFTRARRPDPKTGKPDMARLGACLGEHPEAGPAVQAAMAAEPPASYGACVYHGIHAYRWVSAEGAERYVRFRWEPEAGEAALSAEEARERGPDYLQRELPERLGREPIGFRLVCSWLRPMTRSTTPRRRGGRSGRRPRPDASRSPRSTAPASAAGTCSSSTPSGSSTGSSSPTTPSCAFAPARTRCRWSGGAAGHGPTRRPRRGKPLRSADSWARRRPRAGSGALPWR